MVSKGYISGLLRLYKDWHSKDTQHVAIATCYALLRCLHKVTCSTAGRQAFVAEGDIRLLYQTTQVKFKSSLSCSVVLIIFSFLFFLFFFVGIDCDTSSAVVDVDEYFLSYILSQLAAATTQSLEI